MVYDPSAFIRLRNRDFLLSAVAWLWILREPGGAAYCSVPGWSIPWRLLLALNPPAALARGWALMLVAMMSPMLAPMLYHVSLGSLARRRARAIVCFVAGYGTVWMAGGGVLLTVKLIVGELVPGSYLPAAFVGLLALVWQASPFKQSCLNRGQRHRPFAAFGIASDRDLFCLGLEHAAWCAGSCSLLMLIPLLLPQGHLVAMGAVSALLYCERLDRPTAPAWRLRGFGTAFRWLSLRLRGSRCVPAPSVLGVQG